jgi:hypothetical protein
MHVRTLCIEKWTSFCAETGGVPPWSHDTSKLECLRALGGIGCEGHEANGWVDFSNPGTMAL